MHVSQRRAGVSQSSVKSLAGHGLPAFTPISSVSKAQAWSYRLLQGTSSVCPLSKSEVQVNLCAPRKPPPHPSQPARSSVSRAPSTPVIPAVTRGSSHSLRVDPFQLRFPHPRGGSITASASWDAFCPHQSQPLTWPAAYLASAALWGHPCSCY